MQQMSRRTPMSKANFNKVTLPRPAFLSKKRLLQRCFPVNFAKFLRIPFLQNTSGWLLLHFGNILSLTKKLQGSSCLHKFYREAAMENFLVFQEQRLCDGRHFKVAVCWLAICFLVSKTSSFYYFIALIWINRSKRNY